MIYLDRTQEAEHDLTIAAELRPAGAPAPLALAAASLILGDKAKADYWRSKLVQNNHPDIGAWVASLMDRVDGNFDAAAKNLRNLQDSTDPSIRSWSFVVLADLAADRGDYATATAVLTQGMGFDESNGNRAEHARKRVQRASVECTLRAYDACLTDVRAALAESSDFTMVRCSTEVLAMAISEAPPTVHPKLHNELITIHNSLPKGDYGNLSSIVRQQLEAEIHLSDGRTDMALDQFRKVAVLDAPAEPKLYLARALLSAAQVQASSRQATRMRDEAEALYADAAQRPAYIAYHWYGRLPGVYGDSLAAWLALALPKHSPVELAPQLTRYAALRPAVFQHDPTLTDALQRSTGQAKTNP